MSDASTMRQRIKSFEHKLPKVSDNNRAYVIGHVLVIENTLTDGSAYQRELLTRLCLQFAWRLAYCDFVEHCLDQCGEPVTYEDWIATLEGSNDGLPR